MSFDDWLERILSDLKFDIYLKKKCSNFSIKLFDGSEKCFSVLENFLYAWENVQKKSRMAIVSVSRFDIYQERIWRFFF